MSIGIKQYSFWSNDVKIVLFTLGFKQSGVDESIFTLQHLGNFIIIAVYVCDILGFAKNTMKSTGLTCFPTQTWSCSGIPRHDRPTGLIPISQSTCARCILYKFGTHNCKPPKKNCNQLHDQIEFKPAAANSPSKFSIELF
jgi:hypothetical protein